MICRRTESNDILLELVVKTLAVGAYEMQVEYEDRKEHVLAFQEGVGFGIASLDASSEEAQALREALYQIRRKQKIVTIEGVEYRLRARIHQSFGESDSESQSRKAERRPPMDCTVRLWGDRCPTKSDLEIGIE